MGGSGIDLLKTEKNPFCCLWIEVDGWRPDPEKEGYVIIVQEGGGRIVASSTSQLEEAVEHLKKLVRRHDAGLYMPIGLATNYKVLRN